MRRQSLLGLICLLIVSCGFHLRGMVETPKWLHHVAIVIQQGNHELGPLLQEQLEAYHINVAKSPDKSSYLLIIENDRATRQITNVAASTAPRQYQLFYDVQFTLLSSQGEIIIPSSHVTATRQLTVNNDKILGSDFEENTFYSEMRRDATLQIINKLSLKTNTDKLPPNAK